jgi:hypothetical protein
LKTDTIVITAEFLALISEIDEFKTPGARSAPWRRNGKTLCAISVIPRCVV